MAGLGLDLSLATLLANSILLPNLLKTYHLQLLLRFAQISQIIIFLHISDNMGYEDENGEGSGLKFVHLSDILDILGKN